MRRAKRTKVKIDIAAAPTVDDLWLLMDHALAIRHQDPEMAEILYRTVTWFKGPGEKLVWTKDAKDVWRYREVCHFLEQGVMWNDVFAKVSEELTDGKHGAAASEEQIKKSYQRVQAELPPDRKRPRTWRPPTKVI